MAFRPQYTFTGNETHFMEVSAPHMQKSPPTCTAIILPGGGARGAYQAGVLKAIGELLAEDINPFPVIYITILSFNCLIIQSIVITCPVHSEVV